MKRNVLITGGSSGIGASLVRRFAADYEVFAVARRLEKMQSEFADLPSVHPFRLDLADLDETEVFVRSLVEKEGHIPYVINNAGSLNEKRLDEVSNDEALYAMKLDALSHLVVMREVLPAMRAHDFGRIINLTGAITVLPVGAEGLQYGAKSALTAFTVASALQNKDKNIKINAMGPGWCDTEMSSGPMSPSACHETVEFLFDLDADGPTGRFFRLGYEVPLFPELGDTNWQDTYDDRYVRRVL